MKPAYVFCDSVQSAVFRSTRYGRSGAVFAKVRAVWNSVREKLHWWPTIEEATGSIVVGVKGLRAKSGRNFRTELLSYPFVRLSFLQVERWP